MKKWLCVLGLLGCVGCTTAIVRPYVGEQQNWPIASGSIVNIQYDMPIFTSLPSVPYDILAEMRIESWLYATPEERHLPVLIDRAKEIGADALMFVQGQVFFAATYGSRSGQEMEGGGKPPTLTQVNKFNPDSFKPGVNIVAIRWLGDPPPGMPKRQPPPPAPVEEKAEEPAPETPSEPTEAEMPATSESEATETPAPPAPEAVAPEPEPATPSEVAPEPSEEKPAEPEPVKEPEPAQPEEPPPAPAPVEPAD